MPAYPRRRTTRRDSRPALHPQRDGFHEEGDEAEAQADLAREQILARAPARPEGQAAVLRQADGATRLRALHQLQDTHGNAHVQRVLGALKVRRAPAEPAAPAEPYVPSDVAVQSAFNPMDILHKLLIAIDQSEVQIATMKRHVDFGAVVEVLSKLTAEQAKIVQDTYHAHEKTRTLEDDLFGKGESGFDSDLKEDQRTRLKAMLRGTVSAEGTRTDAALDADAAELHTLLYGSLNNEKIERVMALLRRSAQSNALLNAAYQRLYNKTLYDAAGRMGIGPMLRAHQLLMGQVVAADRMAVGGKQSRVEEIDRRITELKKQMEGWNGSPMAFFDIKKLEEERKRLVGEIEQRTQESVAEARDMAQMQGGDAVAARGAAQERAAAVLGDAEVVAKAVAGGGKYGADAALILAIAHDDPVAKAAAELRKAAAADKLKAAQIGETLRGLRAEAEARVKLDNPEAAPAELDAKARELADSYFVRLRSEYEKLVGDGKHFDDILHDTGSDEDSMANIALMQGRGYLSDVAELIFALQGGRKDMDAVERVLRNKTAGEIRDLKAEYKERTGKDLEHELFGEAPTHADEANPNFGGMYVKPQGKASGTARLNLEDYLQRPDTEGGLAEAKYISDRAEREYDYTIENRGATGAWRDFWGNEQRSLLDETIKQVRVLYWEYVPMAAANPLFMQSDRAKQIIAEMHMARATIRGDRAAYEKAVAALRATFEAIAAFALQAALSAVLGPLANVLLIGRLGQGASLALRLAKGVQTATVGVVSQIGANLAVQGSNYSLAMLRADLLSGYGGALGPLGVEKLLGPYAKSLAAKLGPKASKEITEFAKAAGEVSGDTWMQIAGPKVVNEMMEVTKTVAGMQTGAWAQGEAGDWSLGGIAQGHLMGKGSQKIEALVQGGARKMGFNIPKEDGGLPTLPPGADGATATKPATAGGNGMGAPAADSTPAPATDTAPVQTGDGTPVPTAETSLAAGETKKVPAPETTLPPADAAPLKAGESEPTARQPGSGDFADEPTQVTARPEGDVVQHADPHNEVEAFKLYKSLVAADPRREVALIYNHLLGEWAVVQGGFGKVSITEARRRLGWPDRDVILARHSHMVGVGGQTSEAGLLPSGRGADVDVVGADAAKRPGTNWHAIDVVGPGGKPDRTWLIKDPETGLWTVDYPDPGERGGRGRVSFTTMEQYHKWFENRYGFSPGAKAPAEPGAAPVAHSPDAPQRDGGPPSEAAPSGAKPATTQSTGGAPSEPPTSTVTPPPGDADIVLNQPLTTPPLDLRQHFPVPKGVKGLEKAIYDALQQLYDVEQPLTIPEKLRSKPAVYTGTEGSYERQEVAYPKTVQGGRSSREPIRPVANEEALMGPAASAREAASEQHAALPRSSQDKTAAAGASGATSLSGQQASSAGVSPADVAARARALNLELAPHVHDPEGDPGGYHAGHAEKKIGEPATGVSREQCDDCIRYFLAEAQRQQRPFVVADPQCRRVFSPDGTITEYWENGMVVRFLPDGSVQVDAPPQE